MSKRGRNNPSYKHGLFAGWDEYRYGEKIPIRLAGPKPRPILKGEQRTLVETAVTEAMRNWQQTPFEHEGPVRAELRSALCLAGNGWGRSDAEAAEIVAHALRMFGAKRATWEQGQRDYSTPRENCRWCGIAIDDEDMRSGFCSLEHARFAHARWDFEARGRDNSRYMCVKAAVSRLRQPKRDCKHCGKGFRPPYAADQQVYCSDECNRASRKLETPARNCLHCRKSFVPERSNLEARYCSRDCHHNHRKFMEIPQVCGCCGEHFVASSPKAEYCSDACGKFVRRLHTATRISPRVFDYVFEVHSFRPARCLTPGRFDHVFALAA